MSEIEDGAAKLERLRFQLEDLGRSLPRMRDERDTSRTEEGWPSFDAREEIRQLAIERGFNPEGVLAEAQRAGVIDANSDLTFLEYVTVLLALVVATGEAE
jgi:hypothetical protein